MEIGFVSLSRLNPIVHRLSTMLLQCALAGGLIDVQADPGSVFLYRREPRELAEKRVDCSKMGRSNRAGRLCS